MNAQRLITEQSPAMAIGRRVLVNLVLRGRVERVVQATEAGRWLVYVAPERGPLAGWHYANDCEVLE